MFDRAHIVPDGQQQNVSVMIWQNKSLYLHATCYTAHCQVYPVSSQSRLTLKALKNLENIADEFAVRVNMLIKFYTEHDSNTHKKVAGLIPPLSVKHLFTH